MGKEIKWWKYAKQYSKASSLGKKFVKDARTGDGDGLFFMALAFDSGGDDIEQNSEIAMYLYEKSANAGCTAAAHLLSRTYYKGGMIGGTRTLVDYDKAVYYAKIGETTGEEDKLILALAYLEGHGLPKNEPLAIKMLETMSNSGDQNAMYELGLLYYEGRAVPQDEEKAKSLWTHSAEKKCVNAENALKKYFN